MPAATKQRRMSAEHKKALAEGRKLGQSVRRYLEALEQHRPRRGRKRTPDSIKKRLAGIEVRLSSASPLERLQLVQERIDLERELDKLEAKSDLGALEREFVKVAKEYSHRKGISYQAWREMGVSDDVLRKAGLTRGG